MLQPRTTDSDLIERFFLPSLREAGAYRIDTPTVSIKLDQNESPYDLPAELKRTILEKLESLPWNRYPTAFADEMTAELAAYAGVPQECVLTGAGSNYVLSLIMHALTAQLPGDVYIARPSFLLYEAHCQYHGVRYQPWSLSDDLEYEPSALDHMPPGSLVVFASPNNPVGNVLALEDLRGLLRQHPTSVFVADEAYFEYADFIYTELLSEFSNLIIVRTFSKTMNAASLRLGYALSSPQIIAELTKLRLPYVLNRFTEVAALELLKNQDARRFISDRIEDVKSQRQSVYSKLTSVGHDKGFSVKESQGNFFLLKWPTNDQCTNAYQHLVASNILVRNLSKGPGLAGCLRASIGLASENEALVEALAGLS